MRDLPGEICQSSTGQSVSDRATLGSDQLKPSGVIDSNATQTVQDAERQLIIRALQESGGNRTVAAQKIGMSRRTLHRKLHKYNLEGF